ncbi:MAG: peptidase M14 [Pseudarcicella sp.]|jgi:hypothetical protein|nr:peptidase M14 [Pseudarcicella sp.]
MTSFNLLLDSLYETFQEKSITKRRFGYLHLQNLIDKILALRNFEVYETSQSTEERTIKVLKIGTGKTKILLWSQMHGDEATATMALVDIFNFFNIDSPELNDFKRHILAECTLYFVPMLNPDGAEAWTRHTALGIDMNRDALSLQTPEGKFLKHLQNTIRPDFGFNLHDQHRRYSAGNTGNLATITFLATAFDEQQSMNATRENAVKVIVAMQSVLENHIPQNMAKWPADFEPRAFGDNIQKWGTSLILLESGGHKDDFEKMYIRKLNFLAILSGFYAIATKSFALLPTQNYDQLPLNGKSIFDLIIRNITVLKNKSSYKVDLGINIEEKAISNSSDFETIAVIEDIGDLSVFWGTSELNAEGLCLAQENELILGQNSTFDICDQQQKIVYRVANGKIINVK